jgi:tRNA threonylcarbamoyladenosine biosynthesis protein TsaE
VDAYRLADLAEVEDLDLEASLADSVTVVEWGEGKAEQLADDRLDIVIVRSSDPTDETRTVTLTGIGPRWAAIDLVIDTTPEEIDE